MEKSLSKSLIIGGTGLIGAAFVHQFSNQEDLIVCARKKPTHQQAKWIECDLLQAIPFDLFPENLNQIVYLAQYEHFREFPGNSVDMFKVNVEQFLRILDFAHEKKIKKIVYASSGGIYGSGSTPFLENDWINENPTGWLGADNVLNFYYRTKVIAELIANTYSNFLDITILRFFFAYGEGQKETMFIPRLIQNIQKGIPLHLEGEEGIIINPLYAMDAAKAIIHCLSNNITGTFNVAGSEAFSILKIGQIIGECLHKQPIFEKSEIKAQKTIIGNIEKIKLTGWEPLIKFEKGIQNIVNSLQKESSPHMAQK